MKRWFRTEASHTNRTRLVGSSLGRQLVQALETGGSNCAWRKESVEELPRNTTNLLLQPAAAAAGVGTSVLVFLNCNF
jgi:hypothetical protein